ncbi:MAG: hypothetical protein ABIN94_18725 [Ferruginibacter sp.]
MKQLLVNGFLVLLAFGCNSKSSTTETKATDSTSMAATPSADDNLTYAYTLERPYQDWQPGNKQHAVNVLKSLKDFENGDINSCVAAFGDSVELRFDHYYAKLSNDSLKKMFTKQRGELASTKVTMGDWESVISKDKKSEYVTMWYKQIETDKKGKTDSLSVVDDVKIVNGKIVEIDQKIQHFPTNKKMLATGVK